MAQDRKGGIKEGMAQDRCVWKKITGGSDPRGFLIYRVCLGKQTLNAL